MKDTKEWIAKKGETGNTYEIEKSVKYAPVAQAYHLVNRRIQDIVESSHADEYMIYISGSENFRNDIATIKPYKGNRKSVKPKYYHEVKNFLTGCHPCTISDGIEADDLLGINQSNDTCIATIDKDLDMVPGLHYNWRKGEEGELYIITPEEGEYNFWYQMLVGDSVDNIPGVPGVGKKYATEILDSNDDWLCAVGFWYACTYDDPESAMIENGRLLYMMQDSEDEQLWSIESS